MKHEIERFAAAAFFAVCAAFAGGCFSIEKGMVKSTGEEHVLASNYGWYLFHFIPLACGNASSDPLLPSVLFRNDVTHDKVQARFMQYAESRGCGTKDLSYTTRESVMLEIPGFGTTLPIPYLVTYREVQLSGMLCDGAEGTAE